MTAPPAITPTPADRQAATRFLQLAVAAREKGSFERLLEMTIAEARAEGYRAGIAAMKGKAS